jgi:hypothetical protein
MSQKSKAQQWLEVIDRPTRVKDTNTEIGINRHQVKRMMEAATDIIQDGSPRQTDLFVFADGSALYEKRQDDWFTADPETVAAAQERN